MAVIPLTLSISLCLVFTFVVFFLREQARRSFSSDERESLLPLAEETPQARAPGAGRRRAAVGRIGVRRPVAAGIDSGGRFLLLAIHE